MVASFIIGFDGNHLQGPEGELEHETKAFITKYWSEFSYEVKPKNEDYGEYISARDRASLISVSSELLEAISCAEVIDKLQRALSDVSTYYFQGPLTDFVKSLLQDCTVFSQPTKNIPENFAAISHFTYAVLNKYMDEYVGAQPESQSWALPMVRGCGCTECCFIASFLASSDRRELSFHFNVRPMKHLEASFPDRKWIKVERSGLNHPPLWTWRKLSSPDQQIFRARQKKRDGALARLMSIDGPQRQLKDYLGPHDARMIPFRKRNNLMTGKQMARIRLAQLGQLH